MVVVSFGWPGEQGGLAPLWLRDAQGFHFDLTFDNYVDFISTTLYLRLLAKSFLYAILTTLICLVLAYPLAMLIAKTEKNTAT